MTYFVTFFIGMIFGAMFVGFGVEIEKRTNTK